MWYCSETEKDWKTVTNAVNAEGIPYEIVEIPLTETFYEELEDYGCYLNYYVGNEVVLVPIYGDVNDQVAMDIIASLYPTRRIVGINCLNLALFGGIFLCATSPIGFTDALYESVSALATVGLTAGVTPSLSTASQLLIIVYMYFGRVGVLTISLGFLMGDKADERFRYATTNLLIG